MIKVLDIRGHERFAECGYSSFPFRFSDDRKLLNIMPMPVVELHILPHRSHGPSMEVTHLE